MRMLKLIIALLLALVLMIIVAANMAPVDLHLVPESLGFEVFTLRGIPLALVIVAAFLLGFLIGELVEYARERKHRARLSERGREIARLREENSRLAARTGADQDDLALIRR